MQVLSKLQKEISDYFMMDTCFNNEHKAEAEAIASHLLQNLTGDIPLLNKKTHKKLLHILRW